MKEINDIMKEYADDFFTSEFLLSGDETWDLEALAWFDEKYPELSDEQRSEFSVQLDTLFRECCIQAVEQYRAEQKKIKDSPSPIVFEDLTLHELQEKIIQKFKEHDFVEAKRLLITYQEIKEQKQ